MSQSIPTGTRDFLPEELRELRAIESTLAELFEARDYGEVATPTIEYQDVLAEARAPAGYRFFDEAGSMLALRSDMTVPIARLVADRFRDQDGPFRFRYSGSVYRPVSPKRGQMRQLRQVGIELVGAPEASGTLEVIELLVGALDAIGLTRARIGLGDADLLRLLLGEYGVAEQAIGVLLGQLEAHDLVGVEALAAELPIGSEQREAIVTLTGLRGGREVLERARAIGGHAVERASERLARTFAGLEEAGIAGRVQIDFGLLRDLDYYTGAILEVYDPALGRVLGGGGRYDDLLARFGRPLPAAGFGLYLDRLHVARTEEERLLGEPEGAGEAGAR